MVRQPQRAVKGVYPPGSSASQWRVQQMRVVVAERPQSKDQATALTVVLASLHPKILNLQRLDSDVALGIVTQIRQDYLLRQFGSVVEAVQGVLGKSHQQNVPLIVACYMEEGLAVWLIVRFYGINYPSQTSHQYPSETIAGGDHVGLSQNEMNESPFFHVLTAPRHGGDPTLSSDRWTAFLEVLVRG